MTSSECHSVEVLSTTVDYSLVAMVNVYVAFSLMIREVYGIQCMLRSSRIINEMLSEIHTLEKCDFLKSVVISQIILRC